MIVVRSSLRTHEKVRNHLRTYLILSFLLIVPAISSWFLYQFNVLGLLLLLIGLFTIYLTIRQYLNNFKQIVVLDKSMETYSMASNEIIPFEKIISIKLQVQEFLPGFYVFHPIDLIYSLFYYALMPDSTKYIECFYEIETETEIIYDQIKSISINDINRFITTLSKTTAINPIVKNFTHINARGSVYYFSFRNRHDDLTSDEVNRLS